MESFLKLAVKSTSNLVVKNSLNSCYCRTRGSPLWRINTGLTGLTYSSQANVLAVRTEKDEPKRPKQSTTRTEASEADPATYPDQPSDPLDGKKPPKLKRVPRPMTPILSQEQIKKFSTVLSVNIIGNRFAWCLLDRSSTSKSDQTFPALKLEVLELKIFNLKSRMHFLRILNEVKTLVKEVPASHVCVTEEHPNQMRNQHVTNLCLEVTQARAMFIGTLASQVNSPAIVSIKSYALARLFNTFVGREKVSGQFVMQDLIQTEENIKIEDTIRNFYRSSDSETREYLSNVFLLNLAYWIVTKQYSDRFDLDKLLGNNNGDNVQNKNS